MIELDTPLMMVDKNGKRHVFFIENESGKYVARGPDLPTGNCSFISPRLESIEKAVEYAEQRIMAK